MSICEENGYSLALDTSVYQVSALSRGGETIRYRAFENRVYVRKPVDDHYHRMNIYVPEGYYHGEVIDGFTAATAPIFFPNPVGGYMPGEINYPGEGRNGREMNAIFAALLHGCVVAAPAVRGRTTKNEAGTYTGKAPACIVDLKAVIRYLRHNRGVIPGDTERIITNGTSAGGGLSALLGATGNNPDYEPYLKELGAAEERDDVFASSCYCPVTSLTYFDAAHEWQFCGINDYVTQHEDGRADSLTEEQIRCSAELKAMFPACVNRLGLKGRDGSPLTLDERGNGSFRDHVLSFVIASAQETLDGGADLSAFPWVTMEQGRVTALDFEGLSRYAGRVKMAPGFDRLDLGSPENELFGTAAENARHFTAYSKDRSKLNGSFAEESIIHIMDPLNYIGAAESTAARHWRIRHGTRDSTLAIAVILATRVRNEGFDIDFFMPWDVPHDGDYDLDELFAWVHQICKA